jgi:hypothetical protein
VDADGDPLAYLWTTDCPGGSFDDPMSPTPVLTVDTSLNCHLTCRVGLMVDNGNGGSDSCVAPITIGDTTSPDIACPAAIHSECEGPEGSAITFEVNIHDVCDVNPNLTCVSQDGLPVASGDIFPIGTTEITCMSEDVCGNTSTPCGFEVIVESTPPVITSFEGDPLLAQVGAPVFLEAVFTDDVTDEHVATWDYGDTTGEVLYPATSPVATGHSYVWPGIYTVTASITNQCGNVASDSLVLVVYDPAAGFTTGGGWFIPDADSFVDGINVTDTVSKAHFGFVVRYHQGAGNPDGNLEFRYQAGDIDLKSTNMDWLVVQSATKVRFKGLATVNNSDELHTFKVTAEDNGEPGNSDTFKIEIWLGDVDTENGPPTPKHKAKGVLGGGNIKIHQ